ncbi:hypothetical protein BDN72DRAFT_850197 [Pluteus cervinus]|uniref:Uncharacterized protein n=1 Tax=Pluteus cervinus TaxID=181527 RepID=A0ACD3A592_9AGAR|nr:hypothetical protein BDN72DRAFT_850197 [Pluteus cervinus]
MFRRIKSMRIPFTKKDQRLKGRRLRCYSNQKNEIGASPPPSLETRSLKGYGLATHDPARSIFVPPAPTPTTMRPGNFDLL